MKSAILYLLLEPKAKSVYIREKPRNVMKFYGCIWVSFEMQVYSFHWILNGVIYRMAKHHKGDP